MRYIVTVFILIALFTAGWAQSDSTVVFIKTWSLSTDYNTRHELLPDTFPDHFERYRFVNKNGFQYLETGNPGSPAFSLGVKHLASALPFYLWSFLPSLQTPHNCRFYSTNKPFTLLRYHNAGNITDKQSIQLTHTQNINPQLNVGFSYRLSGNMGHYDQQKSKFTQAGIFASHTGQRYNMNMAFNTQRFKNFEYGGINENLSANFKNVKATTAASSFLLTQKYTLGKTLKIGNDSLAIDSLSGDTSIIKAPRRFVPLASIQHIVEYDRSYRWYSHTNPLNASAGLYAQAYYDAAATWDSVKTGSLKNTVQWVFNENMDAKVRLRGRVYATHQHLSYYNFQSYLKPEVNRTGQNNLSIGGGIFDFSAPRWQWSIDGQLWLLGYQAGSHEVSTTFTHIFADSSAVKLSGHYGLRKPDYLLSRFYSNHFIWENDFLPQVTISGTARIEAPRINLALEGNTGLLSNYTYFGQNAIPQQENTVLSYVSLRLEKEFDMNWLRWQNQVEYQFFSSRDIVHLPNLLVCSSLFFDFPIKFRLTGGRIDLQLGASLYYTSLYKRPAYMPATGVFYLQDTDEAGNYPYTEAFLNLKWKRSLWFFKLEHLNYLINEVYYYPIEGYPLDPATFLFGVQWRFHD